MKQLFPVYLPMKACYVKMDTAFTYYRKAATSSTQIALCCKADEMVTIKPAVPIAITN